MWTITATVKVILILQRGMKRTVGRSLQGTAGSRIERRVITRSNGYYRIGCRNIFTRNIRTVAVVTGLSTLWRGVERRVGCGDEIAGLPIKGRVMTVMIRNEGCCRNGRRILSTRSILKGVVVRGLPTLWRGVEWRRAGRCVEIGRSWIVGRLTQR